MAAIERRQFLRGLAAAAVATSGAHFFGTSAAWAGGTAGTADLYETVVRDAIMHWVRPPMHWWNAPFLGDGDRTAQVLVAEGGTGLVFAVGRAGDGLDRPAARYTLPLSGTLTGVHWRLDPWDAELTGTVTTTRGSMELTVSVPRGTGTLLAGLTPRGGERGAAAPVAEDDVPDIGWRDRWYGSRRWLMIGAPGELPAEEPERLLAAHRGWWHQYYRGSFVSVPDKTLQRFHWLQVYAAASIARGDAAGGLDTPVTLSTTNHLDSHPALAAAEQGDWPRNFDHLLAATPAAGLKSGDAENPILGWNLPEIWDSYRYGADARVLSEVLRPMLRSAVSHYESSLLEGPDGYLHLPMTYSPGFGNVEDSTCDLSLLRWAANRLAGPDVPDDERLRWRTLADRLVPYHTDETGVLLGAGVRLAASQPRPAHLLWMHPLGEKVWHRPEDRAVMSRSLRHWASMPQAWDSRSHLSFAVMAAGIRAPEQALEHLRPVLDGVDHAGSRMSAATLLRDGALAHHGASFEAAQVMMRMLVSADHDDVVDVFPALPGQWAEASVSGLRAPGAFVLDASRSNGRTDWIRVRSEAGRPFTLRHGIVGPVDVRDEAGHPVRVERAAPGMLRGRLGAGESLLVCRPGNGPADVGIRDVASTGSARRWGLTEKSRDHTEALV
ncbi:glycoside hydrolase family 95-like protein [Sciscionella sediminilitoris]|uniref:glycoside hydrolase family 95-like protein n=1 Tax=Sciscionella sediminilitoris TaxID=1445613 RepID=UPI0004DF5D80|nr:hypothetical protein [Sciscionella sp. SE31]